VPWGGAREGEDINSLGGGSHCTLKLVGVWSING